MTISKETRVAELNRFHDDLERAARTSSAAFDQAFNAPPPGLSVHEISPDKKFTRVSSGHHALLGYGSAALVGQWVTDYVILKGTSEGAISRKLAPTAILLPGTRSFRRADGKEITLLMVDRHLKDKQDHIIGIRTVVCEAPKP